MENRTCKISKIIYNKKKGVKSMKKFILPKNPMGGGGGFRGGGEGFLDNHFLSSLFGPEMSDLFF